MTIQSRTVLTEDEKVKVRHWYTKGGYTQANLAKRFGVSTGTIRKAIQSKPKAIKET